MIFETEIYPYLALFIVLCWLMSLFIWTDILAGIGFVSLLVFFILLWISLERPPMRSMGETKLLYALMLSGLGLILRFAWKTPWILKLSLPLASIFLLLNLLRPEAFDKTLMPALQSPFFVPHVVAYIQGYVLVAAGAVWMFFNSKQSDKLVLWGIVFITLGMLMGAFWAKLAWGTYWSWDPKENFALVSWLGLIAYLHLRKYYPEKISFSKIILALNVLLIFTCWFGVNYLPSAKQSVHVYSN